MYEQEHGKLSHHLRAYQTLMPWIAVLMFISIHSTTRIRHLCHLRLNNILPVEVGFTLVGDSSIMDIVLLDVHARVAVLVVDELLCPQRIDPVVVFADAVEA